MRRLRRHNAIAAASATDKSRDTYATRTPSPRQRRSPIAGLGGGRGGRANGNRREKNETPRRAEADRAEDVARA